MVFWFPLKCRVKVSAALANKGGYHVDVMLRMDEKMSVDHGD
jgi:hypothetical protein